MKLDDLGISPQLLLAGFGGGLVNAFALKQASPLAVCGSVIMGAVTANYIAPIVAELPWLGEKVGTGACAFIVGVSAMAIVQGIATAVQLQVRKYLKTEEEKP